MDATQNSFTELFLLKGSVAAATADGAANLSAGEVALFSLGGARLSTGAGSFTDATTVTKAKLIKKLNDGTYQVSDVIDNTLIKSAIGSAASARVEQVSYVGFDGVATGALDITNDNTYIVRFIFDNLTVSNYGGQYMKSLHWKSPTSGTTQQAIAEGLVSSAVANFAREEDDLVAVERVINSAGTAVPTGVASLAFVNGSKAVAVTDADDATGTSAIAVGDYIRVDIDDATSGTALTDPCYKVTAIDATNDILTLDQAWEGASVTVEDESCEMILVAAAASADFGLKSTGQPLSSSPGRFTPSIVTFQITLPSDSWNVSPVTHSVGASIGSDTAEIIAAEEFIYQGNQGDVTRWDRNSFASRAEAEAVAYNSYFVAYTEESNVGSPRPVSHKEIKIAYPDGSAMSGNQWSKANDGLQATLNAFLGTSVAIT